MTANNRSRSPKHPLAALPEHSLATALEQLGSATEDLQQQRGTLAASRPAQGRERQQYAAVLDLLADAYFVTDSQGRIREANRAASGLLGYARRYCLGKPLRALVAGGETDRLAAVLERAASLPDGKIHETTLQFRPVRQSGSVVAAVRVAAIRDTVGELTGFCWLVRDRTAETAVAEKLRMLQAEHAQLLRSRTAEQDAIIRMQATLIEQERTARTDAESRLHAYEVRVTAMAEEVEHLLRAVGADAAAITQVTSRLLDVARLPERPGTAR